MLRFILVRAAGCAFLLIAGIVAVAAPAAADPTIKGFVFVPQAANLQSGGVPEPAGQIDTSGVPALDDPAITSIIQRYIGLPIANVLLDSLRTAIGKHYHAIGRPFVNVVVPKQDVTNGVLQIVVIEGRVGQVKVEGNEWFDEEQYRRNLHLEPGGPIDNNALQADIDWINRNQYRKATVIASEGVGPGATNITIRTEEQFPLSVTSGIDNSGNAGTGLYRIYTGLDWGNALWRGDSFNYRFTTTPEIRPLYQHALSYTTDLPWRDTLTLSLSIIDSNSATSGSPIGSSGHTVNAGLRYQVPLPAWGTTTHSLTFGYDFKSTNNNTLFGGTSVFATTTEVNQFVGLYSAQRPDAWGSTGLTLQLVGSPGGLSALNNTATFQTQQANADASYIYGSIGVERTTTVVPVITWFTKATLQLSNATLLPSEQMAFGGASSNRGFVTSGVTRDNGIHLINEFRAPTLGAAIARAVGLDSETHPFVPFLFVDYGAGWNHRDSSGSWVAMTTIGPGFSLQLTRHASFRFTYGIPVQKVGPTGRELLSQFSVSTIF